MKQEELNTLLENSQEWQKLSQATRRIYLSWLHRFSIFFHANQVNGDLPREKISLFLRENYRNASENTTRQGMSALSWFYANIMKTPVRPITIRRSFHLPERFTKKQIAQEISKLPLLYEFMGWIFAGSGLLLHEAVGLTHLQFTRHPLRYEEFMLNVGKRVPIPLCKEASRIYSILRKDGERIFPKTLTMFCKMSRKYGVDRGITPGSLRANFILLSLEANGIAWTQAATGLSSPRMRQYIDMLPHWK